MTDTKDEIQKILDLYVERKNAQDGAVQFSSLRLISEEENGYTIDLQGTHNERAFERSEISILARRIFASSAFDIKPDGSIFVEGSYAQIVDDLIRRVDSVTIEPHTEHLQAIFNKLGLFNSKAENAPVPYILPYPHNASPLSQFEICDMRGFYVYSPEFIDTSVPERGVLLQLPYSKYFDDSRKEVSAAMLALNRMGLKLPFTDAAIGQMERNVFENTNNRWFPDMHVPTDGRVGVTTLTSYGPQNGSSLLITIMEEETVVGERLKEFASKPPLIKQLDLLPS